jgi:endonuclease/exonuclease/phosphatase family metal-dependent hydrolase
MTITRRPAFLAICCLLWCWGDVAPARADGPPAPARLRVLSYNIHHGEGVDGKLDLERIAGIIRGAEADLVALQEVDRGTRRTGGVDQSAELAKLTGLHVAFGGNISFEGGDYGNAVLSRYPIKHQQNHPLPSFGPGEKRGVLEVEIELASQPLRFFATHLDHRRDDRERVASAEVINQLVAASPQARALLAGDLNDVPQSATLTLLKKAWTLPHDQPLATVPVSAPRRQIDYVLLRPQTAWKVQEARVLDEPQASDHRPLLITLEASPPKR